MADDPNLAALTADIVASYVAGNRIAVTDVAALIREVHAALAKPDAEPVAEEAAPRLTPAQIRRSVSPAGLVSFEDGQTYQMLKRHLAVRGLSAEQYKAKWGLPKDYPTTAPAYAARRAELAKSFGLGANGLGGRRASPAKDLNGKNP